MPIERVKEVLSNILVDVVLLFFSSVFDLAK